MVLRVTTSALTSARLPRSPLSKPSGLLGLPQFAIFGKSRTPMPRFPHPVSHSAFGIPRNQGLTKEPMRQIVQSFCRRMDHLCIAHFVVASVLGSSLYRSLRHRVDARIVSASLVSSSPLCTDDVQRGRWLEGGTAAKIYIHVGPLVAHQWQCTCTASRRITPIRRSPDPHTVP